MVDDDLAAIFTAVATDIEPDLAAVIAEATRQGRRRRARRRLAIVCTASASVLVLAVAATVGAHLATAAVHGPSPAGHGGHRHGRLVRPKAHHTRPAVPQAHGPGMQPTRMLAVLRTLLPQGEVTYVAPYYMRGWLELNFDDGHGAVDMIVSVDRTLAELHCPNPPYTDEGKRPAGAPPISCTRTVLPNGDIVMKLVTEADAYSYYDYAVYIDRPDGIEVSIDVGNGTLEGTPHLAKLGLPWVDRAVPPGSLDFWETVAASPKWHL